MAGTGCTLGILRCVLSVGPFSLKINPKFSENDHTEKLFMMTPVSLFDEIFFFCTASVSCKIFCTLRVTSPHGNSYHYSDNVVEGQFAFQAVEGDQYMTCFFSADHKLPFNLTIIFDWKSVVAEFYRIIRRNYASSLIK